MKNSNNSNEEMYLSMGINKTVYDYGCAIEKSLRERFDEVDRNAEYNQLKVVKAMQQHQVSEACLLGTTGYGYNDLGRDTLEAVYAGRMPMTSSKVSYGLPTGDNSSSPGLKLLIRASASAWVPQVIWGRTRASSVWKVAAYTASRVSLPRSLYP